MADIYLDWKSDLQLTASGDLGLANGPDETRQRIERRLFTAVRKYIWHQEYGAGLPERIGKPALVVNIRAIVQSHIALETTVAKTPLPVITVTEPATNLGLFVIEIDYTDAVTGAAVSLSFEVPSS